MDRDNRYYVRAFFPPPPPLLFVSFMRFNLRAIIIIISNLSVIARDIQIVSRSFDTRNTKAFMYCLYFSPVSFFQKIMKIKTIVSSSNADQGLQDLARRKNK